MGSCQSNAKAPSPRVSLIINNYNYADFLHQAIESCLQQTYAGTEIIVVDDGSTDASPTIIASYSSQIRSVFKQNGGQASAINAGFEVSSGDIVIFLDADDYLFSEAVQKIVNHWQPRTVQLQYRLSLLDQHGECMGVLPDLSTQFHTGEVWPIILQNGRQQTTVTSGNAFSREALTKILPIPETEFRIAADGYLVSLVPSIGSVAALDQSLGVYRQHPGNLWSSRTLESEEVLLQRLHRSLQHDYHRYHWIQRQATQLGHGVSENLAFQDYSHLVNRLSSLCISPQRHPFPTDSPGKIGWVGVISVGRQHRLRWQRKCMFVLWFLSTGFAPSWIAAAFAKWLLLPCSRPWLFQRAIEQAKALR